MLNASLDAILDPLSQAMVNPPPPLLPLRVQGLTLDVGGKRLISDISFTLHANTLTVVMGPNGAGKSLLLRLLHGMRQPTKGVIDWGGTTLNENVRRRQAMVFQQPVLLRRSVAANIDFVLQLRRIANPGRRDDLLEHVGLRALTKQPARLLSGGEQQRLALARALALTPDVLLLDEPTASLDPASVKLIEQIVRDAHHRGTKVIFVTHDIGQAKRLADDIVFLHDGRVQEQASASSFFDAPASEAAQAYLEGRIYI